MSIIGKLADKIVGTAMNIADIKVSIERDAATLDAIQELLDRAHLFEREGFPEYAEQIRARVRLYMAGDAPGLPSPSAPALPGAPALPAKRRGRPPKVRVEEPTNGHLD